MGNRHWIRPASAAALLVWLAVPVVGARRLLPPTAALLAPENRVAVVTAVEEGEGGRVVFSLVEALHGESDERFEVRIGDDLRSQIEFGRTYVLGYTTLRRDPRGRSRDLQPDPEGARIFGVPTVGPALFEDTAAMRRLATPPAESSATDPRGTSKAILDQLSRPDPLSRRFVLAELVLRPSLLEAVDDGEVSFLREILEGGELEPMEMDYLLQAVTPLAGRGHGTWIAETCRQVIGTYGPDLDLASHVPTLLATAIEILGAAGRPEDLRLLEPHLQSNNPGVGRAAIQAMGRLDAAAAEVVAARALAGAEIHPDVRIAIERFLATADS